jgi:hypothetical protein
MGRTVIVIVDRRPPRRNMAVSGMAALYMLSGSSCWTRGADRLTQAGLPDGRSSLLA